MKNVTSRYAQSCQTSGPKVAVCRIDRHAKQHLSKCTTFHVSSTPLGLAFTYGQAGAPG